MARTVVEDVNRTAIRWGRFLRRDPEGWPAESLMYRIYREGPAGAATKVWGYSIPGGLMPDDVQLFHRAWSQLRWAPRVVLWICYVDPKPMKRKASDLGVARSTLYDRRNSALKLVNDTIGAPDTFR